MKQIIQQLLSCLILGVVFCTTSWAQNNDGIPAEYVAKINNKQQLTNLATIYLDVPDAQGKAINDVLFKKNGVSEYHRATIEVIDNGTDGTGRMLAHIKDNLLIKVRGNQSADETKKPYRLKFAKEITDASGNVIANCQKHDMLGFGYEKRNWTLLTNHRDASLMNNALAYHIGKAVGLPFCPGYKFVDLVINGEYRGNYQISDHCEVGDDRIEVDEETGWYIETNKQGQEEEPYVNTAALYLTIKNPEPKTPEETAALKTEVKNYFDHANTFFGIYSTACSDEQFVDPKTGWRSVFDEETLVKYYVAANLTGNHDGFMTVKTYRNPGEKLKFGPIWDHDNAFGGIDKGKTLCENAQEGAPLMCNYVVKLMEKDPVFVKKVHDKLDEVLKNGYLDNMAGIVEKIGNDISESQALNYKKWWTGGDYPAVISGLKTYITTHTGWLQETINTKYTNHGGADIIDNTIGIDDDDDDDTPVGDLGALVDLGNGKYSYTGSASTFKEGTEITITTSTAGTTLSNYITEGTTWNTSKTITLTAADVTALANSANKYTFFMNATGGEVKAVNVKVPEVNNAGLKSVGKDSENNNVFTYTFNKSDVKEGAKVTITLNGTDEFHAKLYTTNQWSFDYGLWNSPTTSTITLTPTDVTNITANNYTYKIVATNCTVTSVEVSGSSSGSEEAPTHTLTLSASEGGTVSGAGTYKEGTTVLIKAIPNEGYKFVKWSDDNTYASRSVTLKDANIELTATFAAEGSTDEDPFNEQGARKQFTNLPTIYLDATVGNEWSAASLEVFDADNKLGQGTSWTSSAVETQYQGSGDKNKDSYRLKFGSKTQLLSSGKFKQWVLLANDDDPTMMRNALAKEMGDVLGLPFTPGYQFVDLYVNNTYMGTYQVTDRIKVESGRALVTGGNKEFDWHVRFNDAGEYNEDKPTYYIAGTETMPYIIPKNPDPKDDVTTWNSTLKDEMTTYFNNVFTTTDGEYTAFAENVDHQQLIEWYIAQEMLGVYKGFSSIEAYRSVAATDQNLHIGILWDSEKAFGNTGEAPALSMADLNTAGSYNGLMTNYAAYDVMKNIFSQLWQERWFANGVNNLWKEKHEAMLTAMTSKAAALKTELEGSWAKNATKWSITGEQATSINTMTSWLTQRDAYLTKKFAALAAAVPCETHTYENHNYIEQTNGTFLIGCDVCGTIMEGSETYYKFTVYPESAESTEVFATSWHPSDEHPNSIAVVEAEKKIVEKIDGYNIVCGKKSTLSDGTKGLTCKDFRLTDGHPYYSDNKFVATTATYSRNISNAWGTLVLPYKMQNAETAYASFYHLGEVKATDGDASTLVFTSINPGASGDCSAYIPVVFKATDKALQEGKIVVNGTNITVKKTTNIDPATELHKETVAGWSLIGTIDKFVINDVKTDLSQGEELYYISKNQFWHATGKYTNNPFRAYFISTSSAGAKSFNVKVSDDEQPTNISDTNEKALAIFVDNGSITLCSGKNTAVRIYTAAGSLIANTSVAANESKTISLPSGLYIVNGTKVTVR
ncbi:MAG: CotH kinase family protein [Bacteroidaceae bacterium]|nr:CotH kinase family protein [Bacteroidaceae bacterium]